MSNENVSSTNYFNSKINIYKRKYQDNDVLQKQSKPLSPDEGQCSSDFPSFTKPKQKGVIMWETYTWEHIEQECHLVNKKQKIMLIKRNRASTCKTSTNEKDIEFTVSKFHELTAQGPLHICTCRDQLWYKNGVLSAKNLRQSNSNMSKFLCNKRSHCVDNVEWLCKTCHRHLISNKIPPCAVVHVLPVMLIYYYHCALRVVVMFFPPS